MQTPSPASVTVLEALRLAHDEIHHPGATRYNTGQDIDAILRAAIRKFAQPAPTPPPDPILAVSLAQLAELEATGRAVLCSHSYAQLAASAWKLHAALYSLQSDAVRGADAVDLAEVENLAVLLETLRDEQGRAVA